MKKFLIVGASLLSAATVSGDRRHGHPHNDYFYYYGLRVNGLPCLTGVPASMCRHEHCEAGHNSIVSRWRGGADEFQTCQLCWEVACEHGHSEFCDMSSCTRPKPSKLDRIAIIGGGVQGLFMARKMKRAGYVNVTVFEKEQEAAASTETLSADGYNFDWSTKIISADRFTGPGFLPELQQMITEYGLTTRPYLPGQFYDSDLGRTLPLPYVLLPYTATPEMRQLLVGNMIAGFELLKDLQAVATTPEDIIHAGIAFRNETWSDFAARIDLPAFTTYAEFLANGFVSGPITDQSAAVVLNTRVSYQASYIKSLLLGFGIDENSPLPLSDELRSVLANPYKLTGYVIDEGYQTFFDRLIEHEGIDICLGCEVKKVRYNTRSGDIKVKVIGIPRRTFDHVIISSRPHDSIKFMKQMTPQRELMRAASPIDPVNIFMFRTESTPPVLGSKFVAFVYPGATYWAPDGSITGLAKDHNDSNIVTAIGYSDPDATSTEAIDAAVTQMESIGMPVSSVIGHREYPYVSVPPVSEVENGWFEKTTFEQGARNTYVIGEVFCGYGVPTALRFVNDFFDKHF